MGLQQIVRAGRTLIIQFCRRKHASNVCLHFIVEEPDEIVGWMMFSESTQGYLIV